jgi:hypothetical protein
MVGTSIDSPAGVFQRNASNPAYRMSFFTEWAVIIDTAAKRFPKLAFLEIQLVIPAEPQAP